MRVHIGGQGLFGEGGVHGDRVGSTMRHFFPGTLGYVALDVHEACVACDLPYISAEDRKAALRWLRKVVRNLDRRPLLRSPGTAEFAADLCARASA